MSENEAQHRDPVDRLRVMIADDVQEVRRSTRLMLTLVPEVKVVAIAHNGLEAVELARQHKPDIALMDISMPEMDGLSAIKQIMAQHPNTACVVISAERESQMLREAMSVGARGYLVKPFMADELVAEVRRVSELVRANRERSEEATQLRQQRDTYLIELAEQYLQERRTDNKALQIFEQLATNPECDLRWLQTLAVLYVFRRRWQSLRQLSERLERDMPPSSSVE